MGMLQWIKRSIRGRYDLARARAQMRGVQDHELLGRYCGLMLFPFVIYVCVGSMGGYTDDRIRQSLVLSANGKDVQPKQKKEE